MNSVLEKTKVIITGYPKSGNTWLTRLTAELLGAPVIGFWESLAADEIAIEGRDRRSEYECYKSHHSYPALLGDAPRDHRKVIHIVRDPRDIVLSGANYFLFERGYMLALKKLLAPLPKGKRAYFLIQQTLSQSSINESLYRLGLPARIEKMITTVLQGDNDTHDWCSLSWCEYVEPYLAAKQFEVRYENLLDDPFHECQKILNYLEVKRTDEEIIQAIEKQSFGVVKAKFEQLKDTQKSNFLNRGKKARWCHELSTEQIERLNLGLGDLLTQLKYLQQM